MKIIKGYRSLSIVGRVLLAVLALLVVTSVFKTGHDQLMRTEGFASADRPTDAGRSGTKDSPDDIYDEFYSSVYDSLVYSDLKNKYELEKIAAVTKPDKSSVILDVGSGTGQHVAAFHKMGLTRVVGVDISGAMVRAAQAAFPNYAFSQADVRNNQAVAHDTFTHITCFYFTIYYLDDKQTFFHNCADWLMRGGYLVVHVVDKDLFDPIVPAGNPLHVVSAQKYAKARITTSRVVFDEFEYASDFRPSTTGDPAACAFVEKFKFKNGATRTNNHTLFMDSPDDIAKMAQAAGFLVHNVVNLVSCGYDNQYLYIFTI